MHDGRERARVQDRPVEGRPNRAAEVTADLRQSVREVQSCHWKIGKLLAEVKSGELWRHGGYASFGDYVRRECKFGQRKADLLVRNHRKFVEQLGLSVEQVSGLPWSNAALVAGAVDRSNQDELLPRVAKLSQPRLKAFLRSLAGAEGECAVLDQVSMPRVADPLPSMSARPAPDSWMTPRPAEDEFYVAETVWRQVNYAVATGKPTLLVGPTGCGKTELVGRVAAAQGRSCEPFNFGAMTEARTGLIGTLHLHPKKGTWFSESRFVTAFQRPRCVLLLDEISRAGRDAFNILIPVLDGQGYLSLDEAEQGRIVQRARGLAFLATANVGVGYTGTEDLDLAILDRMIIIVRLDYPELQREVAVLKRRCPGLDPAVAERLARLANHQRRMARDGEFVGTISTRALLAAGDQLAAGIPFRDAFEFCILNRFPDEGGVRSEREKLLQILEKEST